MIPPIIEKMDTASLDITNGSRAQLHATTQHTNNNWNSCSLVNCEDCCTVNLRTKSNTWGCKQPFSKWNSSFQSWFVCQNQVDQLRISFCNFTKKASMKNVKRRTCKLRRLLRSQPQNEIKYLRMQTTPFQNEIRVFSCDMCVKIKSTNFAFPTITSPKITQLQIWNDGRWEHCNAKNVWR